MRKKTQRNKNIEGKNAPKMHDLKSLAKPTNQEKENSKAPNRILQKQKFNTCLGSLQLRNKRQDCKNNAVNENQLNREEQKGGKSKSDTSEKDINGPEV